MATPKKPRKTKTVATTDLGGADDLPPCLAKTPGVKPTRTRAYVAGLIIAKYGLAAGVTKAMVAELDRECGYVNPWESKYCLKNAWHAARGYSGLDAQLVVKSVTIAE